MYDYISLQTDSNYSKCIEIDMLQKVFNAIEGCIIRSNASATIQFGESILRIQGIKCDTNGNYAFDDDSEFKEINLIEINIPEGAESSFEAEIRQIANQISKMLAWQIDWRE